MSHVDSSNKGKLRKKEVSKCSVYELAGLTFIYMHIQLSPTEKLGLWLTHRGKVTYPAIYKFSG